MQVCVSDGDTRSTSQAVVNKVIPDAELTLYLINPPQNKQVRQQQQQGQSTGKCSKVQDTLEVISHNVSTVLVIYCKEAKFVF